MNSERIPIDRVIYKLDELLSKNNYDGAKKHLEVWLTEAEAMGDFRGALTISNECIGINRKMGNEEEALKSTEKALKYVEKLGFEESVTGATTYINTATAYKAFGKSGEAMPFFQKAMEIYERELPENDSRLGGLYNNMALALADIKEFKRAREFNEKAIEVMGKVPNGQLEQAITYLNMASALDGEKGLEDVSVSEEIGDLIEKAKALLDKENTAEQGYYAFVCEKCASTFGYYGYFLYEEELLERARRIYERD